MGYRILLGSLLLTALGYLWLAAHIPMDPWTAAEAVNNRTLPLVYGTVLLGVVLLLLLARPRLAHGVQGPRLLRLVVICLLALAFVATLPRVGLWVALGAWLATAGWWLGERRWQALAATALLIPLGGWLLVEQLLGLYLGG